MLIDEMLSLTRSHTLCRLWIISDLQQSQPQRATHCMQTAVRDFLSLSLPVNGICYLGDATEGADPDFLREMTAMQEEELSRIDAPIYYTPGNHDFDFFRAYRDKLGILSMPFLETVQKNSQWHVQSLPDDFYFFHDFGPFCGLFLPDHADPEGQWFTSHGKVRGDAAFYPYTADDYRDLMKKTGNLRKSVVTFSHYAFAGGNRAAPLFDWFLPLPDNVRIHFYGHAHIGDYVWAKENCYRKIACVDRQPIVQVDVASLESGRGSAIRSVIFEWYDTGEIGLFFRNHSFHLWDDILMLREGEGKRVGPYRP
mgnify:CR=1 FL=1